MIDPHTFGCLALVVVSISSFILSTHRRPDQVAALMRSTRW